MKKFYAFKTQTKASKLTFNQIFLSKKQKQKHLSNIQPDIKKRKLKTVLNTQVTFIQTICKTFI